MQTRHRARLLLTLAISALLSLALTAPASARPVFPDRIDLPDGFLPEGITIGKRARAYLGSLADGDLYAVDLRTGQYRPVSEGPGTPSVGLKVDKRDRLFVAGGPSGQARVVSARTGEVLASYALSTAPTFVNDVVLTRTTAWFTDSLWPVLYGIPLGRGGALPDPSAVLRLPLSGDWGQQPGFNANGIAQTPDRSALLVIQSNTGRLFRVDPATGVATEVDLGGVSLMNGDGLLVLGRTLYVVRNRINQVSVIKLDRTGTRGVLTATLTSPDFAVPTTVAAFGNSLYLPNARFGTPPTPTTDYWVTRIARAGR